MKQVMEFADKYNMLPGGAAVICAVSGGADSVCLLHMIKKLAECRGLSVYAAHFNHRLRGEESERDEAFVRALCKELGVELFCDSAEVAAYAEEQGMGIEEAARISRYRFFERTAAGIPGSRVATAHNADDNAETVLMNLARGSGAKGLSGIPPVRDIYIRPLLCMSRGEIIEYLEANGLEHVEDSSNAEDIYTRNCLRHNVMPVLKGINPDFTSAVLTASELLREDERLLEKLSEEAAPASVDGSGNVILSAAELLNAEYPLSARAIRKAAGRFGVRVGAVHVNTVLELAASANPSAKTQLPGALNVRREYERVVFSKGANAEQLRETELRWGEWTAMPELDCMIYFGPELRDGSSCSESYRFRKADICGNVLVRPRRSGDRICLDKRQGSKTLKKLFIEKKIPAERRDNIPVIADNKKILAIISLGQSADSKPGDEADCVVAIKMGQYESSEGYCEHTE